MVQAQEATGLNPHIFKNFISMGPHCCIRLRINDLLGSAGLQYGETGMFDYNICDTETLKTLVSDCDISQYFNKDNIEYKKTNDPNGFAHVSLKNVNFKSIHDVPNRCGEELESEIKKYVAKYKRRHRRLLDMLKSKKEVAFVYMERMSDEDAGEIRENISRITKKITPIIRLHDFGKEEPLIAESGGNFRVNYARLYKCEAEYIKKTNWIKMEFLDWDGIFSALEKVYLSCFKVRTNKVFL